MPSSDINIRFDDMENKCGFCDKKTLSLRRCSGCHEVSYCSTVCQKEDWKRQHKVKCKELQKHEQSEQAEKSRKFCNIPDISSATGGTLYPSEAVHGVTHEMFMEYTRQAGSNCVLCADNVSGSILNYTNNTNEQNDKKETVSIPHKRCHVCRKESTALKICTRCKIVNYCSKKCQRQDWKSHKLQCKDPEEDVNETIITEGYKREEKFASKSAQSADSSTLNRSLPFPEIPNFSHRSHVQPGALDKVKSLTWKVFPGCTILDYVREIPHEQFGMRHRGTSRVAVGFISRYHSYVLRHCIYLQDKDGDEVYVGFYFERDEPRPYFRWSDVVPGRYLCIADPYIHRFLDGSVGIRVDDPSAVRAFTV